jgi:hypothetical protein
MGLMRAKVSLDSLPLSFSCFFALCSPVLILPRTPADSQACLGFGKLMMSRKLEKRKNMTDLPCQIFASIVMDVMISYGPLFPFAQYTLATT